MLFKLPENKTFHDVFVGITLNEKDQKCLMTLYSNMNITFPLHSKQDKLDFLKNDLCKSS